MNFTIRKKLLISNLIALSFVSGLGTSGYLAVRTLDNAMDAISLNSSALRTQLSADQMHDTIRADVLNALLAANKSDKNELQSSQKEVSVHIAAFHQLLKELDTFPLGDDVKKAVTKVRPDVEAYLASANDIVALALKDPAAAQNQLEAFIGKYHALEKSMEDVSGVIEKSSATTKTVGDDAVLAARRELITLALLSFLSMLVIGYFLSRSITKPLDEAIEAAKYIADGDLAHPVHADKQDATETGRLKQALFDMTASLLAIVQQVRSGADAMTVSTRQLAEGNMALSARTEQQAGSLEETASSMEELTSTVKQNADNAQQANQLAHSASEVAVEGGSVVNQVVHTMGEINSASRKIVDIISVIDGIAFQTNILALNAAVEAARAGEQGRGFAVVAAEVRTLAQRAAGAAKEIKMLINDSVDKVDAGTKLASQAGATMENVVAAIQRVTDIMSEITAASQEQSAGIEQVNQAITSMDTTTQQNAALVEEAAAATESVKNQAEALAKVVSVFKVDTASTAGTPSNVTSAVLRKAPASVSAPVQVPDTTKGTPAVIRRPAASKTPPKSDTDDWEEF